MLKNSLNKFPTLAASILKPLKNAHKSKEIVKETQTIELSRALRTEGLLRIAILEPYLPSTKTCKNKTPSLLHTHTHTVKKDTTLLGMSIIN